MTLITRRFKSTRGEIDLILLDGMVLVFVEVKMSSFGLEAARLAITEDKRERLHAAAHEYVVKNQTADFEQRLDVVLVCGEEMEHIKNAFSAHS